MPLIEAQPNALAKVYAKSLFELAQAQDGQANATESILGELEDIVELARNDRAFSELLASRLIDSGKRDASLERMFSRQGLRPLTLNFLRQLNRKGRLANLSQIATAMDAFVQGSVRTHRGRCLHRNPYRHRRTRIRPQAAL